MINDVKVFCFSILPPGTIRFSVCKRLLRSLNLASQSHKILPVLKSKWVFLSSSRFRWRALSGISCRQSSSSSSRIWRAVSSAASLRVWSFHLSSLPLDSNKKLEEVLEEFCGPTSKYKFNQDDVSKALECTKRHLPGNSRSSSESVMKTRKISSLSHSGYWLWGLPKVSRSIFGLRNA